MSGLAILLEKAGQEAKTRKAPPSDEKGGGVNRALALALRELKTAESDEDIVKAWKNIKDLDE